MAEFLYPLCRSIRGNHGYYPDIWDLIDNRVPLTPLSGYLRITRTLQTSGEFPGGGVPLPPLLEYPQNPLILQAAGDSL